jgi:hypothetical protein
MTNDKQLTEKQQIKAEKQKIINARQHKIRTKKQKIRGDLQMFIGYVENGKQPPDRLMKFMADGARDFLLDGLPWHTMGDDGGAPTKIFRNQQYYFILNKVGGLLPRQIIDVFEETAGQDAVITPKTMREYIKKGERYIGIDLTLHPFPPFGANNSQWSNLKAVLDDLISGSIPDLDRKYPEALVKLNSLWAKIEVAEAEWSQEPRYE